MQRTLLGLVTLLGFAFIGFGLTRPGRPAARQTHIVQSEDSQPLQREPWSSPSPKTVPISGLAANVADEKTSLQGMTQLLVAMVQPTSDIHQLMQTLNSSHQNPTVNVEHSPTGSNLFIVQTENPPRGTVYFHAQYFSGPGTAPAVQHMSFQFRPAPQAMSEAIAAVQTAVPGLGKPRMHRDNFVEWDLPNSTYVVWVKRLDDEDLRNDPFHPYMPEDVGSIRMAVEQRMED